MGTHNGSSASNKSAPENAARSSALLDETDFSGESKRVTAPTSTWPVLGSPRLYRVTPRALQRTWRKIDAVVLASTEEMVLGLVDKAKEGNTQAAKFLFELVGIRREGLAEGAAGSGDSLAAVLLSRLDSETGQSAVRAAEVPRGAGQIGCDPKAPASRGKLANSTRHRESRL
jgi:hypothetical protein